MSPSRNVRSTLKLVASGETPYGIVLRGTDARRTEGQYRCDPLRGQPCAYCLSRRYSERQPSARSLPIFLEYLSGDRGARAVCRRWLQGAGLIGDWGQLVGPPAELAGGRALPARVPFWGDAGQSAAGSVCGLCPLRAWQFPGKVAAHGRWCILPLILAAGGHGLTCCWPASAGAGRVGAFWKTLWHMCSPSTDR